MTFGPAMTKGLDRSQLSLHAMVQPPQLWTSLGNRGYVSRVYCFETRYTCPSLLGEPMAYSHDQRVVLHPIYINSLATLQQGRRLPKEQCAENPTLGEVVEVLKHIGFDPEVEDKCYPRDALQRGRIRVNLKDPKTGKLTVSTIKNRKQLFAQVGTMIPNLKARKEAKDKNSGALPGSEFFPPGAVLPPGMMMPPPGMVPSGADGGVPEKRKGKKKNRK